MIVYLLDHLRELCGPSAQARPVLLGGILQVPAGPLLKKCAEIVKGAFIQIVQSGGFMRR
jgi:hypothetical protein